ncbi:MULTISPECIES: hypothetical protein [Kitasatospora]|uniref:Uncharacterized protein n=1 Tax=Kitasatospora griseola TaxID=2064 RepID=A0A0D0PLE6_KITGR|nr:MULTISPECIES: hypothetical protein [Kitasatospora]KIQ63344.1 hypothetical protein TR51_32130 [Kitasatospora griseola]GGQ75243.1 hypothetical protein GCM10010195_33570 [Kitasatospora griseola]
MTTTPKMPENEAVYTKKGDFVVFNQLALKIEMDAVSNEAYYAWLDDMAATIGDLVPGAQIAEKENARVTPPLNTAIYYDTEDFRILRTGALLRTSCNKITHAFCAFKAAQDENHVRKDHRYVFDGEEKRTIQGAPDSPEAVAVVKRLLARTDIEHPGRHLEENYGIPPQELFPALKLDDYRYTFFVWLDKRDALRCSIDRAFVSNLRLPEAEREVKPVSEVELAIYPRIDPEVAKDPRVVDLIKTLSENLCARFDTRVTADIKYQRSAKALGMGGR